jgi:sulfur carrier protein
MQVWINGQPRTFPDFPPEPMLDQMIAALAIQADRVAVEQNGEIVPRTTWATAPIHDGDRFEIVHFVGGGTC